MTSISKSPVVGTALFRHERVDADPPCSRLGICLTTDLTGNGFADVIVGGAGRPTHLVVAGNRTRLPHPAVLGRRLGLGGPNLFWYENPGWHRHDIAHAPHLGVGHALGDLDGDGRVDLVVGQGIHYHDLYWFEQPVDPREPWRRHLIDSAFERYHDLAVADVDDDGEPEVVGLSQGSETLFYYDVPDDPTETPWPADCRTVVERGFRAEGLAVLDIDGDGRTEVVAGPNVFSRPYGSGDRWVRTRIVAGWDGTRVAVGDVDGDGQPEVVLSEGDSPAYGRRPGRVAWFDPPDWRGTVIDDGLFCPHSLQLADFDLDGRLDVYVGEMGLGQNEDPRHIVYRNVGAGEFERHVVDVGVPTHEAKVADLTGDGRPDVVGKSYGPGCRVDAWYNEMM